MLKYRTVWLSLIAAATVAHADAPAKQAPAKPPAAAETKRADGLYELITYEKGAEKTNMHDMLFESLKGQGMQPIIARMTFDFGETSVTIRTFLFEREKDGSGSVCDASLTTDVTWQGDKLVFPASARAAAQFVRVTKVIKKQGGKTTTDTASDSNTCDASIKASTMKLSRRGNQVVLQGPEGGFLIFNPTTPDSVERDDLAKQL